MPETSIVIRTLNEERHIGNLLQSIKEQDYRDYEIIIVDSGSRDKTLEIASKFDVKILKIESRDFTFGYSLNVGCRESRGKYLVFVSAHILPTDNNWLSNMIAPFENEKVAVVYGRQLGHTTSKFSERNDFKRFFKDKEINLAMPIYYANNANSAIRKSLWEQRKFDEYLFGLEDIDFAKSMTEKGFIIHYEPKAGIYHIHEEKWYQVFNRYRREAIAAVRIGLIEPPQARLGISWLFIFLFLDLLYSFPNYTLTRLEEIFRFRYYQSKGSRIGWKQGKSIDFESMRKSIFYPEENEAVIIKGKHRAEIEGVPIPEMKPGDLLIKVDYVGVCRTDIEVYEGTLGYYRDGVASYPITPGHEFSGTIAKIGSNNKFQERFKIGQRVVGECILSRGKTSERKEVGVINFNGAYSKFFLIPGDSVHKIPDNVDSKTAVLTEPLAVVLRALRRIEFRLKKDFKIVVIGAGQIGNLCAQVLVSRGFLVTVFDSNKNRLNLLSETVNQISTGLSGVGDYDVIIEATGSKNVLEKILKEGPVDSTILLLGFPYGDVVYNFEDIVGKEKVVVGSVGAEHEDFVKGLELLPKLNMRAFTEKIMPLEDFEKAWQLHKTSEHLKIILKP